MNLSDSDLLRRFAESNDDDAFAQIVERHIHVVYSTARRVVQNDQLAEEVAQDAFCVLARKGRGLSSATVLVAWLHRVTWHLAMKALRNEIRRRNRDEKTAAIIMNTPDHDALWKEIAPLLDEAIEALNQAERKALLLRFFDHKAASEIGAALGVSEEAARMRISRAVDKLRTFFAKRGVTCGSASLAAVLETRSVQAAPTLLAVSVLTAVRPLLHASLSSGLTYRLIKLMALIKVKTAVISGIALVLAILAGRHFQQVINPEEIVVLPHHAQLARTEQAHANSRLAKFFARASRNPKDAAEIAALAEISEILYEPEPSNTWPPRGIWQAIQAAGSRRRAALDLVLEALRSTNSEAKRRAVSTLQDFHESAAEFLPEIKNLFKFSSDDTLLWIAAGSLKNLEPSTQRGLAEILGALQQNPAASRGVDSWLAEFLKRQNGSDAEIVGSLSPLLKSDKTYVKLFAAVELSRTSGRSDPALIPILTTAVEQVSTRNGRSNFYEYQDAFRALTAIGPGARPAADAVLACAAREPGMQDSMMKVLASIAPDLRTEIPALDEKLKDQEAAAALKLRTKEGAASVAELVEALGNGEARLEAVTKLGAMGDQAREALPRLQEILKSDQTDPSADSVNYLMAVAAAVRKMDPDSISYYSVPDLDMAMLPTLMKLQKMNDQAALKLKGEMEQRAFGSKPFDRDEVVRWVEKVRAFDPQIGESFVHSLKTSPGFSQIEKNDPALAKLLTPPN